MANYKFIFLLIVIFVAGSACKDDVDIPDNSSLRETEQFLVRTWQYEQIEVDNSISYVLANEFSDPACPDLLPGFFIIEDVDITRRFIRYDDNHSYQLRWDRASNYDLGQGVSWQPRFGFWDITPDGDSLIHNSGQYYQVNYQILELSDSGFIRQSHRVLTSDVKDPEDCNTILWEAGETVLYREIFK